MIDLLSALATYIQSAGIGIINAKTGTAININLMHESPVNQIVVYQVGGPKDVTPRRRPLIQILVRSDNRLTAATMANSIWQLCDNKWCTLGTSHRGRLICTSELGPPAEDENGHTLFAVNAQFYTIAS